MTSLETFYGSFYQQPLLLGAPTVLWLFYLLIRSNPRSWVWCYCAVFSLFSILDAWLTANEVVSYGPLQGTAAIAVPMFFIILGDLRVYFWLLRGKWFQVIALSLVVPISSAVLMKVVPHSWTEIPRAGFLAYEVLFIVVFGTFCFWKKRFDRFSAYALGYYGLWVLADLGLLVSNSASNAAWSVRIFANLMYYVGWAPFCYFSRSEKKS